MSSVFFKSPTSNLQPPTFERGFTLLEMIVVMAIFLITTGIALSNFKGFTRKSSLDLLAREMSLVIRQA
jgi:prepilin-type N-terminal cleavage/methylation domain-containing protein